MQGQTTEQLTASIVRECLREYGLYVIEDRAIADVRDGLKPVQRRLLWVLQELNRHSTALPVKCGTVVGDALKYHPHGDSACYGALVTLSWLRYPLVQQHGNFGNRASLVEASPAAYRYTETRLSGFADRIFDDIGVMPMGKSYTEEHDEPPLLPVRVPLLLVNGCTGVAVGLATNIPPHNLKEVLDACQELLSNPDCTLDDLLKHVKGPDYGTGILISKKAELRQLYETGAGRLSYCCNYRFEDTKAGRKRLVITGFNPGFRSAKLIEETRKLVDAKLLDSVANDEGSMDIGTRVVIEFSNPKIIQDRILPLLQSSITYQFYALDSKRRPHLYGLKELLTIFLNYRRRIEKLVLQDRKKVTQKKLSSDQARLAALDNLSTVLKIMNTAGSEESASQQLQEALKLDAEQAKVILDTQLRSFLRKVNRQDVLAKIDQHLKQLAAIELDLANIDQVVSRRLQEMAQYGDARGTRLRGGKDDLAAEEVPQTTYYVGVTPQAKVDSFNEPPIKSKAIWGYVDMVSTQDKFVVVSEDNVGQSVSLSFLDKFDQKVSKVVGLASEGHAFVVAITTDGRYVAFPPDQRRTQFPVFKDMGEAHIAWAGGLNQDDILVIKFQDGTCKSIPANELKVTRPNVQSHPIAGRKRDEVASVAVLRSGTVVADRTGEELGSGDPESMEWPLFSVASQNNLVVTQDGKRLIRNQEETLEMLRQGTVTVALQLGELP